MDQIHVSSLPRERILLRWGALAFLLIIAVVVALFAYWQRGQRAHESARLIERLETLADGRKKAVRSWIEERNADAQVLAWDPDMIEICVEGTCPKGIDLSIVTSHLENLRFFSGFLGAYLFTPSGLPLLAAEGGASLKPEISVLARQAAREKRFLLHDLHYGEDGTPMVGFLAPVFQGVDPIARPLGAPVLGVVGIYLDARDTLFPVLTGAWPYTWDAEVYLVRREGDGVRLLSDVLGAVGAMEAGLLADPEEGSLERVAARDGEQSGVFVDFRGTRVLAAVRWISEAGWGLVAKVDEERGLAAWRERAQIEGLLVAAVLLCLLLAGVAAWRWWSGHRYRLLLEALRDREERLQALALGSTDVVFLKAVDGRYLLVNPAAADLLGTTPEAALGHQAGDYLDPAVSAVLTAHDRQVLETGLAYQGEEVISHRGVRRTFLSSRVPIRDSRGALQGVAGVLRDITRRKRDELALARWVQTLGALYRLARCLADAEDVQSVYASLLDGAGDAISADVAALYLPSEVEGELRLADGRRLPAGFDRHYPTLEVGSGLAAELTAHGDLLAVSNCLAHSEAVAQFAAEAGVVSLLAVPLHRAGGRMGLLALGFIAAREFRADEGEALALLGHMVGVAADRCSALASLVAETRVRCQAEERLRQLHASTAGLTGPDLFREVARAVAGELGAKLVMVSRLTTEGVAVPCAAFYDGQPAEYAPYAVAGTPCQQVVATGEVVSITSRLSQHYPDNLFIEGYGFSGYAGTPLRDSGGRVAGLLCAFYDGPVVFDEGDRDLLELYALRLAGEMQRLLAEEELAEARRTLATLIENLPGAVYRCDYSPDRPLRFMSAGSRVVTGYDPSELLGDEGIALGNLVIAEDRSRVWREVQLAVAEARPYKVEYRIYDRGGDLRWVYEVGSVVWALENPAQPVGLEGVLFDHTERQSLEAQLSHSQRMDALGRLAGGVAHDFNNLLTAISGYAELLMARLPEDPRAHKAAGEVLRATDRAAELTRQLLAFGRRQIVDPKRVELDELVGNASRMLQRLIGEDVCFQLDLDAAGAPVRVDPGQVEQILLNLVVNARDAMPVGGDLTLRTRRWCLASEEKAGRERIPPGEYVCLEVADSGVGIPHELLDRLFDPFFTTKQVGSSSGLGLAAVHGAVHQAGGHIVVESEPGVGTTVRVLWPLCGDQAAAETEAESEPGEVAMAGRTVMLVEDEDAVRGVTAEHLADLGYRVSEFRSGVAAAADLDDLGRVHAVVTDVVMPGMSGPGLVDIVRQRWPELPVVYISGHAGDALREIDLSAPATAFLQKPFRLNDLELALRAVFDGQASPLET